MNRPPLLRSSPRLLAFATLLLLTTCTEEHGPAFPKASWITPTGQVTANPPALLVGAGDIGNCGVDGDEQTALLLDGIPGTVFTLGDDAYESGSDVEFATCYDPNWGRQKARTRPAPGNHEYNSIDAAGYFNYFGAAAGEIGKGYYSYDLGDWHIIVLNSSGGSAGTNIPKDKGSAQEQWLAADLAAHPKLCTLAYWHYPLYSSIGGLGEGGATISEVEPFWDDLYAAGVDLVVNAHRHFYERQAPQKPDRTPDPVYGIRQIISGTGGNEHAGSENVSPNSEVRNSDTYGVLKLWLYADSYAWKFVPVAGQTFTDTGSTACHGAPGSGPPVSAALSTVSASPATLTAGSGNSTVTVTVKDGNGNPISGATVLLSATGSGDSLVQPGAPTNASGVATGTLGSTAAGTKTVSATANGMAITQTASVTVDPGPVSAAQSTVAASPASVAVGGTATITVTAKDANGNPISGATVVLAATGSGNTLTQPGGTTNASGVATGTLSSSVAGTTTVSATINGTAVTQTAAVKVTGPVSASQSTVAASPGSITAGSGSATITVTAKDAAGNPIGGATVVLAAAGAGNTLTQPSATTNASGVATGTLGSTVAGTKTVSATINGTAITQTAAVTVTAGPVSASQSTVSASPGSIAAGTGTATITATAKDAFGNPISGASVSLAATGGGNTLTQPAGPTGANGVATGTLSSTVLETKTVSATIDGVAITRTATVTVTNAVVSASLSTVTAAPTSIPAGPSTATITVTVKDPSGKPIEGVAVALAATGSGNTLTQPSGPTNASGVATGTLSSTVAETKTVSATANGTAIIQKATVTVTSAAVSAQKSTVKTSTTSITAGSGTATITVTVKDGGGRAIKGATVILTATGSGNAFTQPGPTNGNGVATGTFSSTVAESKTVSATANGVLLNQKPVVIVKAGSVSATQSTVTASPLSILVGTGTATITVTARDAYGNPIGGRTVALAATGSGNTLTQPSSTTNSSGVATGTLRSTVAETKTVSATINVTAIAQTATVTVTSGGAVSAAQSTVGAAPTSITAGSGSATITVTAKDGSGNPISGATVVLAATGSGNTLTQPSGPTNVSGVATGTLSSTVAEPKTVSATANGTAITQTAAVTVNAGPVSAAQSTVGAAPASITAGSGSSTITVTARDANGNPIGGATVTLAATGSGNTLTQPGGPTNASGAATGALSSTVAESKTVSATINGTAIAQTAAVTVMGAATTQVLVGAAEVTRCDYTNDEATALLLDNIAGTVFTAGDNIRASGSLADFTDCYGPSWGRHKGRTRPAAGAYEYQTAGASGYFDYFGAVAGERDKGYYSYDLGDWHVVVLNSNIDMTAGSPQEQWLRGDLAASAKRCTLAYWSHPRFSSYSTLVRASVKPLWDALYAAGAELVLNGHYRLYERFAPQTPDGVADAQGGIRQFTIGTGGIGADVFGTTVAPNSEVRGSGSYGVLKLTLTSTGYSWQFVPVPGSTLTDSGSGSCH